MSFVVAIDGPAAAGKGTLSRAVAAHFGFAHLDTGLLYRAVGQRALAGEDPLQAARTLQTTDLENDALRTAEVAQAASSIAAIADVRAALLDFQRAFARRQGGAVLDGRDIGTVICPDAEVKIFVTANDNVRAHRRYLELKARGDDTTVDAVMNDLHARDARDRARQSAPLTPAHDAVVLDTSSMDINDAVTQAVALVASRQRQLGI
jgi:cytidylate kinase